MLSMSEILQENLGNLIRGKEDINIEKLKIVCKSHLETQWKNKKCVWDKNSVLSVDELTEVLLKNQNCSGLTPARCVFS